MKPSNMGGLAGSGPCASLSGDAQSRVTGLSPYGLLTFPLLELMVLWQPAPVQLCSPVTEGLYAPLPPPVEELHVEVLWLALV